MNKYFQHMQHIATLYCPTKVKIEREIKRFLAYEWIIEIHGTFLSIYVMYVNIYIVYIFYIYCLYSAVYKRFYYL